MDLYLVLCVCPQEIVDRIIAEILGKKLASSIDAIEDVSGLYGWQQDLVKENEVILLMITYDQLIEDVVTNILELHPYEMPVITYFNCDFVHFQYESWIEEKIDLDDMYKIKI